ncbi:MAG: FtsX-like permease family protein [Streptosporangiaceae bacterium]
MLTLTWLRGLAGRRGGRLGAAAVGVAIAVALLASLGSFLASSESTMTARSIQRVAVDWQVEVQPGFRADNALAKVRHDPRVAAAKPVGYATTTGFRARASGTTLKTGPGKVLGLPSGYRSLFPGEVRYLTGARSGVLLFQQTAANLHATVGDTIAVGRTGLPPVRLRVAGIVALPHADALFQKVGAPPVAQPQAPPDNVLLLPKQRWQRIFGPLASGHPSQVKTQIHVRTQHRLPAAPSAAYTTVRHAANHLEATLSGGGLVGDNLGAALGAARSDAAYARILFLVLGAPGAVLAGLLTAMVAGAGAARRRREQALLRTRGATARQLLRIASVEAGLVGIVGGLAGLGLAALVGRLAFGSTAFGASPAVAFGWSLGALFAGVVLAAATVVLPARRDLRATTVAGARQTVGHPRKAWWLRYGLDLWLLAAAGVVFYFTSRGNYELVLAPEGVPRLSVSYWAFAGPALFWLGGALLAWRLTDLVLRRGRPLLSRALRPLAGGLAGTVAASLARQRTLVTRTVVLIALAAAFAASTAVFDATYRQQVQVDALLTNGADVTVTESPGASVPPSAAHTMAHVHGVSSVEPLQHRFAYVGSDLQDLYGVRPSTIVAATQLQDAYFAGGTARQLINKLARQPNAILVSKETVRDFQLHPGDLLRLRLVGGRTGKQVTVPFHYAGVVKEFPTAPHDSFLVANASYIAAQTRSNAVGAFLINTGSSASPPPVAARLRRVLGPTAHVTDIVTSRQIVGSSLTTVGMSGLTTVELAFAAALAAAATGLLLSLSFAERSRTLALARALGARSRQLGGFVWAEVAVTAACGVVFGIALGWGLSEMLIKVLTGVFDPPPAHLAVPWPYLGGVAAIGLAGFLLAAYTATRSARRPAIAVLRDL